MHAPAVLRTLFAAALTSALFVLPGSVDEPAQDREGVGVSFPWELLETLPIRIPALLPNDHACHCFHDGRHDRVQVEAEVGNGSIARANFTILAFDQTVEGGAEVRASSSVSSDRLTVRRLGWPAWSEDVSSYPLRVERASAPQVFRPIATDLSEPLECLEEPSAQLPE